jgi:antitoxin (DNA-binding transcriptional repressor) of toxin-antitoxin stability system
MQASNINNTESQSKIVNKAINGEEVIICKAGKPTVKLVKFQKKLKPRKPGPWAGKVVIADDFDELPEYLAAAFRGEHD